jgi:hypothetical protein
MTTSGSTQEPYGTYDDFLNALLPVETPPTDGNCPICRIGFAEGENEEEDPFDEIDHCTTTQSRILAAALAAAMEDEIPQDIVVRLRNCGHLFHKGCICTWIDKNIAAPAPRRSCPLCKTELVRYGPLARVESVILVLRDMLEAIYALQLAYVEARAPLVRVTALKPHITRLMEDFRHEPWNASTTTMDSVIARLQIILENDVDRMEDIQFLEQCLRDGRGIRDSLRLWYAAKRQAARAAFRIKDNQIRAQLIRVNRPLDEVEDILKELFLEAYSRWGYTPAEAAELLLEDFILLPLTPTNEIPYELTEGSWHGSDTAVDLEDAVRDAEWLREMAFWVQEALQSMRVEEIHLEPVEGEGASVLYTETLNEEDDMGPVFTENIDEGESRSQDQTEEVVLAFRPKAKSV